MNTSINQSVTDLSKDGYSLITSVYSASEIAHITALIDEYKTSRTLHRTNDMFVIRQFLKEIPEIMLPVFNLNLHKIIKEVVGKDYFLVKSIFFDKPGQSNWFVPYHQDLIISGDQKIDSPLYSHWTVKPQSYHVQPPLAILENMVTIRIHLDDTDHENGALKIIPGSHLKKIYRPETINWNHETEKVCELRQGSVMLMKPLLLHRSEKSVSHKRRRVIHLEFSNRMLESGLNWSEMAMLPPRERPGI